MLFGGVFLGKVGDGLKTHAVEWRSGALGHGSRWFVRCLPWGSSPVKFDGDVPRSGRLSDVTCRRCVARLTRASSLLPGAEPWGPSELDVAVALAHLATLANHGPSGAAVLELVGQLSYAAGARAKRAREEGAKKTAIDDGN